MAQTAVRDYLRSKGLKDEEIGYQDGNVLAKGKKFMSATPQADGRTYADQSALDSAYRNYTNADIMSQLGDLKTRATTPNADYTAAMSAIKDRINKPVQAFNYTAEADPQYQNALRQAQQNAQSAQNNTLAGLRAHGQGKSSYSETVANQIQQKELGNVTMNVLPQLLNQAYQRYMGQQQLENQQLGNMMQYASALNAQDQQQFGNQAQVLGLQNNLNQQGFENDRTLNAEERQRKQDHIALAEALSDRYGINVNPTEDPSQSYAQVAGLTPLAMQQYLASRDDTKFNQGMASRAQDFNESQSLWDRNFKQAEASRAAGQAAASLAQRDKEFAAEQAYRDAALKRDSDPNSLENRIKQANLDKIQQDNTKKAGPSDEEKMQTQSEAMVAQLRSGKTTPESALQLIGEDERLGFYKAGEGDQLRKLIYTLYPEYDPAVIAKKQADKKKPYMPYRPLGG